jgi:hypothetical protein
VRVFRLDFFTLTHSSDSGDGLPSAEELMAQGVDPGSYVVSEYERMERLRLVRNQASTNQFHSRYHFLARVIDNGTSLAVVSYSVDKPS